MTQVRYAYFARATGAALAITMSVADCAPLSAPNVVEISDALVTSGQPSPEALAGLGASGFGAVVYLAPPTVVDAVRDEAVVVARQGLTYVNVPVRFDNPTEADFETIAGVLSGLANRKVLVHCQANMRASTMVFLYRVIQRKENAARAYESVTKVWMPEGPWKRLIQDLLAKHGIEFEPF